MTNLARVLKERRENLGLTLRQVEDRTGVSNAYLSQVENGHIRQPSPTILDKLATVYNLAYADLMDLAGFPTPKPSGKTHRRAQQASFLDDITPEEKDRLEEYLLFLRSRRQHR